MPFDLWLRSPPMQNSLLCHSCSPGNHNRINNNHLAWQRFSPSGINVGLWFYEVSSSILEKSWGNLQAYLQATPVQHLLVHSLSIPCLSHNPEQQTAETGACNCPPVSKWGRVHLPSLISCSSPTHIWHHICSRNIEHFKLVGGLALLSHIFKK